MILREAIRELFSKAFTIRYPKQQPSLSERFKGKHEWDEKICIYCFQCQAQCPTKAISINKEKKTYTVDLGKCIFCGLCQQVCPTGAIVLGKKFQLASTEKGDFVKRI